VRYRANEPEDVLDEPNLLRHTTNVHHPQMCDVMGAYTEFYAVNQIKNLLYLYYIVLGVLACCMRQNNQLNFMNIRQ
jgi:hypothetical protein